MDIEKFLSLNVLYMDIVRMIKLYAVWAVIVAVIVAYLQNINFLPISLAHASGNDP